LVVERDPPKVAAAINQLMNNPDLRNAMGRRGAEVARKDFAWPTVARQMLQEYKNILSRRSAAGLLSQ
jgi:glycosyltransferase involved in cell wall biosynthesis